jgi:asparagine synthase (glutamine-hydrolysing)
MSAPKSDKTSLADIDSGLVNVDELRYLLTLRYYPSGSTRLPKLTWRDFVPYPGIENGLQPILEGTLRSAIDYGKPEKVGMAISGGVDSTSVLALTRKLYPDLDIRTLCITFGDDEREAKDAERIAEMFDTDHQSLHVENPIAELSKQIAVLRVPRWNAYTYYIFEHFGRSKVDMLLTGDGGDELFGGYVFRYKKILELGTDPIDSKSYLSTHMMDWVPDQEAMFGPKIKFTWENIYSALEEHFKNPLDKLGQTFLADYNGKLLYDFAPTNAAFAKHFKVDTFAPLLSKEVINIASHLPYSLKYDHKNNVGKIILRRILIENFAYESAIKPKIGFGLDRAEMWNKTKNNIVPLFENSRCVEMDLIDRDWLRKAIAKAEMESDVTKLRYITKLFMIFALEVWLRLFVTKELKASDYP